MAYRLGRLRVCLFTVKHRHGSSCAADQSDQYHPGIICCFRLIFSTCGRLWLARDLSRAHALVMSLRREREIGIVQRSRLLFAILTDNECILGDGVAVHCAILAFGKDTSIVVVARISSLAALVGFFFFIFFILIAVMIAVFLRQWIYSYNGE